MNVLFQQERVVYGGATTRLQLRFDRVVSSSSPPSIVRLPSAFFKMHFSPAPDSAKVLVSMASWHSALLAVVARLSKVLIELSRGGRVDVGSEIDVH